MSRLTSIMDMAARMLPATSTCVWPFPPIAAMDAAPDGRYADAIYVAAAERHHTPLLTADSRIGRSGAPITCQIITVGEPGQLRGHQD